MNILAFDTCLNACSAAVGVGVGGRSARVVGRFEPMATGHAERLVAMISDVLADAGLPLTAIDHLAVTVGPGTFTGTRIGVACARALLLARPIPVTPLTSLAVMARQAALLEPRAHDICVAVDVRRDEVYAQVFDPLGRTARSSPMLLTTAQAAGLSPEAGLDYVGSAAGRIVALCHNSRGIAAEPLSLLGNLLPDARDAIALVSRNQQGDRALTPMYLRPPDAKPSAEAALQRKI
jgi:tRNA threonylcarbamoyladenosine biosynthesis protein TsaB